MKSLFEKRYIKEFKVLLAEASPEAIKVLDMYVPSSMYISIIKGSVIDKAVCEPLQVYTDLRAGKKFNFSDNFPDDFPDYL